MNVIDLRWRSLDPKFVEAVHTAIVDEIRETNDKENYELRRIASQLELIIQHNISNTIPDDIKAANRVLGSYL